MIELKTENWSLKNIETIFFDKDGTFIDLHYFWGKMTELRCAEIIQIFGLSSELFENLCLSLGYNTKTQKMLSDGITALYSRKVIIELFRKDLEKMKIFTTEEKLTEIFDYVNEIFYKNLPQYTKPIPEAIDFIKKTRALGVKQAIVTSDSIISTNLTLNHFQWNKMFDFVAGRESSTETKESGALAQIALKKLNANPETTLMIGDAPMDYLAASNAGIAKTILIATGQIPKTELEKTSPYAVNSLKEIKISSISN